MRWLTWFMFTSSLLLPQKTDINHAPRLMVWNVGQGQWVTWSESTHCLHIDAGGEFAPWEKLIAECRGKTNPILLTHGDKDHIRWVRRSVLHLGKTCLLNFPREPLKVRRQKFLQAVPKCSSETPSYVTLLNPKIRTRKPQSNDHSFVFQLKNKILIPGDSPIREEKLWQGQLRENAKNIFMLVLGHHGSRTSTSNELLGHLPALKMAVASSRQKKYGHPHRQVRERLAARRIPLLTTEYWGNLYFGM